MYRFTLFALALVGFVASAFIATTVAQHNLQLQSNLVERQQVCAKAAYDLTTGYSSLTEFRIVQAEFNYDCTPWL